MTKKEQAKVVRDIADEIEEKGWFNFRLGLGGPCCIVFSQGHHALSLGGVKMYEALGIPAGTTVRWNDSHDTVESLLADLRARADFLAAAPEASVKRS